MNIWKRILAALLAILMIALTGCGAGNEPTETADTAASTEPGSAAASTAAETTVSQSTEAQTTEPPTTAAPVTAESSTEEATTEGIPGLLKLDQLEDCLDWIGKTPKKAGIPKKELYYEDELLKIDLEGSLFGKAARGGAYLEEGAKKTKVCQVLLTSSELSYEEALAALTARYGAPIEEKTDKSGQTDQGDVTYAVFENGKSEVWLSKGSLEDFIRVEAY